MSRERKTAQIDTKISYAMVEVAHGRIMVPMDLASEFFSRCFQVTETSYSWEQSVGNIVRFEACVVRDGKEVDDELKLALSEQALKGTS